jgi:phage terminase small subunit
MKLERPKTPQAKPPGHLLPATRQWWASVVEDFEMEPHHIKLLTACCECWDRAIQAREAVASEGMFFTDRHGARKPHPGLIVERDNRTLFARLLRELALDVEPPDAARPPRIGGY